jgi:putative PIN family toxin of toxin-antitoxin system
MKAVLDTNILVSALLRSEGNPANVLNLALNGNITLCYDSRVIAEYRDVLLRPKFGFERKDVELLLDYFLHSGISIVPSPTVIKFIDEDDRKFYEVAKSANAVLITGNKKHYPDERNILSVAEFMEIIRNR